MQVFCCRAFGTRKGETDRAQKKSRDGVQCTCMALQTRMVRRHPWTSGRSSRSCPSARCSENAIGLGSPLHHRRARLHSWSNSHSTVSRSWRNISSPSHGVGLRGHRDWIPAISRGAGNRRHHVQAVRCCTWQFQWIAHLHPRCRKNACLPTRKLGEERREAHITLRM